jgi:hypothetical protein
LSARNAIFEPMYIIKVKGIAKIPDYVQLRDDKFTLLAYFRVDRPDKSLIKLGFEDKQAYIMGIINDLPFGQVTKLDI